MSIAYDNTFIFDYTGSIRWMSPSNPARYKNRDSITIPFSIVAIDRLGGDRHITSASKIIIIGHCFSGDSYLSDDNNSHMISAKEIAYRIWLLYKHHSAVEPKIGPTILLSACYAAASATPPGIPSLHPPRSRVIEVDEMRSVAPTQIGRPEDFVSGSPMSFAEHLFSALREKRLICPVVGYNGIAKICTGYLPHNQDLDVIYVKPEDCISKEDSKMIFYQGEREGECIRQKFYEWKRNLAEYYRITLKPERFFPLTKREILFHFWRFMLRIPDGIFEKLKETSDLSREKDITERWRRIITHLYRILDFSTDYNDVLTQWIIIFERCGGNPAY